MYTVAGTTFIEITSKEDLWLMTDGIKLCPRAAIQISNKCPPAYLSVIREAIICGYIEPIAYMSERDYLWATLEK